MRRILGLSRCLSEASSITTNVFLNILSTLTVDRRHVLDELCTTVDGERFKVHNSTLRLMKDLLTCSRVRPFQYSSFILYAHSAIFATSLATLASLRK
jgi:hypothetical protein